MYMYEEVIENIKPKPIFNLTWYTNEDKYSDGDIEDVIIQKIIENPPENYVEAIYQNFNWPVYYHLTHTRKNILNWYPFSKDAEILEIGCGFGAITNLLCERCKHVTAVELSKRRATGTWLRCREKQNLEIIVGNLNDIQFEKKFDYITLIGVLEYQGKYTDTENPYVDFLKKIKTLLKPSGKLLIAIENKCGLKYWCGAREDHTGIPFDGLNGYNLSNGGIRTFSKEELREVINLAGYDKTFFYYPMPDYKLPTVIYSEKCGPKNEAELGKWLYYIPNTYTMPIQERELYNEVIRNGVFEFFANSFLVECSTRDDIGKITYARLNSERTSEYRIGTRFAGKAKVEKFSLEGRSAEAHLIQTEKNYLELSQRGIEVLECKVENAVLIADYVKKATLDNYLRELYIKGAIAQDEIYKIWDEIYRQILMSSDASDWKSNIMYSIGMQVNPDEEKYGKILKEGYVDMIPANAFFDGKKIVWFDQEWKLENVPASYIMFRAIFAFYVGMANRKTFVTVNDLALRYGLVECWDEFNQLESAFIQSVTDAKHIQESTGFQGNPRNDMINCIKRIMG